MTLPELCIRRPVMTTLLMLAFVVFGMFSYRLLPVAAHRVPRRRAYPGRRGRGSRLPSCVLGRSCPRPSPGNRSGTTVARLVVASSGREGIARVGWVEARVRCSQLLLTAARRNLSCSGMMGFAPYVSASAKSRPGAQPVLQQRCLEHSMKDEDDDRPKKKIVHEIGQDLALMPETPAPSTTTLAA